MQNISPRRQRIRVVVDEEVEFSFLSSAGSCDVDKHLIETATLEHFFDYNGIQYSYYV